MNDQSKEKQDLEAMLLLLKEKTGKCLYLPEEIEEIKAFVQKTFGEIEFIYSKNISPLDKVHGELIVVKPTEEMPFTKVVTLGYSAFEMNLPPSVNDQPKRVELVIFLPKDWDVKSSDEKYYWPLRYIQQFAGLPSKKNTWIGIGHTFGCEDGKSFAENTRLSSLILVNPLEKDKPASTNLSTNKTVSFLKAYPLYEEELLLKMKIGSKVFFKMIEEMPDFEEGIDVKRDSILDILNADV